jgi:VWFA-related protein
MKRAALLLTVSCALLAQDNPVIRSNVVNVQVPVTVTDKKGRAVTSLTAKDFELVDNGAPQSFTFDVASHPVSMVIALQTNSGVRKILPDVIKASSLFVPLVAGETGEIAVIAFDGEVRTLLPFTSRANDISSTFLKLKTGSDLHRLNDAAVEGIRLLHTRAADRKKILLLISEAQDKGSEVTTRDVFSKAEVEGILIYAVTMKATLPPRNERPMNPQPPEARAPLPMGGLQTVTTDVQNGGYGTKLSDLYEIFKGLRVRNAMDAYAKLTGGSQVEFSKQNELEDAISKIGREIHNQYVLTFAPREPVPGYHALTINVLNSSKFTVRARRGYNIAEDTPVSSQQSNPKVR